MGSSGPFTSNISLPTYLHTCTNRFTEGGVVFWIKKDFGSEHFILNPKLSLQIINNIFNKSPRLRSRLHCRQDSGFSPRKTFVRTAGPGARSSSCGLNVPVLNWNSSFPFYTHRSYPHGMAFAPVGWIWLTFGIRRELPRFSSAVALWV